MMAEAAEVRQLEPGDAHSVPSATHRGSGGITLGVLLIVLQKLATAGLLWSVFALIWLARGSDPLDFFVRFVLHLFRGNPPGLAIRWVVSSTQLMTTTQMTRIGLGVCAYAAVETMEGIGLLLRKTWAEWLVILVTISFIPLEAIEIANHPTLFKVGSLVVNLIILWYLLRRMNRKRSLESSAVAFVPETGA